ncbi:nucleoside transporter-domain-containing protein [Paraphysoderma sedebokerense]|nr:nucleoside transporter-domain-containing protein [Paraphysoderma sedebokerense]KAI9137768.1 nucleoside transporter-domain-containing protein [Paraphysoderma sedebokerense]
MSIDIAPSPTSPLLPQGKQNGPPKDKYHLAILAFFMLGIGMLFPWNAFITVVEMWEVKFGGTIFEKTFENYFSIGYMMTNLFSMALSLVGRSRILDIRLTRFSLLLNTLIFAFLAVLAEISVDPTVCFGIVITLVLITGATGATIQSNIIGLSSQFEGVYTQAVLTGQGLAGFCVAFSNLLIRFFVMLSDQPEPNGSVPTRSSAPADKTSSASVYFTFSGAVCLLALLSYLILHQLPIFRYYTSKKDEVVLDAEEVGIEDNMVEPLLHSSDSPIEAIPPNGSPAIFMVLTKIREEALSVFLIFFTTLLLFPSFTSSVTSVVSPSNSITPPSKFTKIYMALFPTFSFVLFNLFDFLSRFLPSVPALSKPHLSTLHKLSLLRLLFIPLFMLCHTSIPSASSFLPQIAFFQSDWTFFVMICILATSNGYLGGMLLMLTPQKSGIRHEEKELVGRVMSFALLFGLTIGALMSFALRATLCRCNPFLG